MIKIFIFLFFLVLSGCCNRCLNDEDYRTVPVTNNPHIVPDNGSIFSKI